LPSQGTPRVKELRRELGLKFNVLEATLVQLILLRDIDVLSQEEFDQELEEIKSYKDNVQWNEPERYEEDIKKEEELRRKRSKKK
jgi:hypothetical protein